ncbi:MAG TPA: glycosyltransferase [Thermodesulfobacteriaceae bacterium]|nr:glycosyltransferase [Thermodesulfobacteriaceae bacterium]
MELLLVIPGAVIWFSILLAPWRPWSTREYLDAAGTSADEDFSDITVVIPTRNEAAYIERTLHGLYAQGKNLSVILVDDRSDDGTSVAAAAASVGNLTIIHGRELPKGWSGKLWALEQGLENVNTRFTLLMDADIELKPGILALLRNTMREKEVQLISLMAHLRMESFWERMMMPAFVYFFKLLYPFRLSNSAFPHVAAAAGGCILVETAVLRRAGGFEAIKDRLIDDCALAGRVKAMGYRTWTGLTRSAVSLRAYDRLETIWEMVARTAFTQLRHSPALLMAVTVVMVFMFLGPAAGLFFKGWTLRGVSVAALTAMTITYVPTLVFYGRARTWAAVFPVAGMLFLLMTWSSALRHCAGRGAVWKGRRY